MRQRARYRSTSLAIAALVSLWTSQGYGQMPDIAPIPRGSEPGDVNEVDDVVDDAEVLPRADDDPATDESAANVERIKRMQRSELSYSNQELRSRYAGGLSAGYGSFRPWQTYSFDAFFLPRPDVAYGLFAGGGSIKQNGVAFEESYDLTVESLSLGFSGRYFFERLSRLSVEALCGYTTWNGRFRPLDGVEDDIMVDTSKVSSSYRAAGIATGLDLAVSWVWESGVFIDWTVVGFRRSRVTTMDLSRDAPAVSRAVTRDLERAAFYGLTNLRVGYLL